MKKDSRLAETSATVAGPGLEMFTFGDLVEEIESKASAAKSTAPSWELLLTVARELQGDPAGTGSGNLLDGRTWLLTRIVVQGFRGILNTEPLVLEIDPTPGITVLHGPNGSGKSSISEATEVALSGRVAPNSGGTGGKRPLWEPVRVGRGSTSTRVSVTLRSGSDSLELACALDRNETPTWTCMHRVGENQSPVELGSAWQDALNCHQPVVAYATLERQVQLAGDLARYFEQLLALGGAFTALNEVTSR